MKQLLLEDLEKCTDKVVREGLINEWEADKTEVSKYFILIGYESVGDYGCDSSAFYLLRNKKTKKLFTVYGSHCSCYGFEGQFNLEPVELKYLKSDKFSFYTGGYDNKSDENTKLVKQFISKLRS